MGKANFTDEFKLDAIQQITERGYSVADVSHRLGVSTHSLYSWMKRYNAPEKAAMQNDQLSEISRLKQELARVTEERDILKKSHRVLRQASKMKYAFIKAYRVRFNVCAMCRILCVHPSGFYAWMKQPLSHRAYEDIRQTALIKEVWHDSGKVYGYRKLHDDLRDQGETCCPNRVARLANLAGIKAQIGYTRRSGTYGGKSSIVIDNILDRRFDVNTPDKVWVTDITYTKAYEGFSYLAVVIDLFSRRVVG